MTFGGGSRSCIGLKFGQLEMSQYSFPDLKPNRLNQSVRRGNFISTLGILQLLPNQQRSSVEPFGY